MNEVSKDIYRILLGQRKSKAESLDTEAYQHRRVILLGARHA